jgi:hypothetical protein
VPSSAAITYAIGIEMRSKSRWLNFTMVSEGSEAPTTLHLTLLLLHVLAQVGQNGALARFIPDVLRLSKPNAVLET